MYWVCALGKMLGNVTTFGINSALQSTDIITGFCK